ncbi:MAG: hypothetical protein Aurels2KO_29070 [Aureliella sp.]
MMNNTIEAYLLASTSAELNEVPLNRSRIDVTSDRIESQMEALVEVLAEAQTCGDETNSSEAQVTTSSQ